ncbi:dehydrogenase/reductase SDR family member 1-like [Paramacrobiotus metropolitanus]|uniref:dehydrogenase/reductase SDR family member 1-like n=1 Tax=Paramacrobiotus metropolitanus TaxID=2943436 RepID=UPI0024457125|nr:dehydrogenase/reductase SDR family member 1-like [Paramacrobiotus metropolitanus]
MSLSGKVVLVTGASRGIGKGVALQLRRVVLIVYITAAGPGCQQHTADEVQRRGGQYIHVLCDPNRHEKNYAVFQQIVKEQGRLDILVSNAYSGAPELYGNHYICAVKAARIMTQQKTGLIINVSSSGGGGYLFTPVYGIGKAACDPLN